MRSSSGFGVSKLASKGELENALASFLFLEVCEELLLILKQYLVEFNGEAT